MKLPKEIISKFPKINLRNADPKKVKEILFIFYGILLVSTIYHVVYAKRIIPGVRVSGVDIGGMVYSQALSTLQNKDKDTSKELVLKYDGKEFIIRGDDIGLVYDWESTVTRAFEVGRTGNAFIDTKDKIAGLFKRLVIPASYDFKDDSFGIKLSIIKGEVNKEPVQSGVSLVDNDVVVTTSGDGRKVDDNALYGLILNSFDTLNFSEKNIPVKNVGPDIEEDDVSKLVSEVKRISSEDILLSYGTINGKDAKTWLLDRSKILDLISFEKDGKKTQLVLDDIKFEALANEIGIGINELPRGSVVSVDGNRVTEFRIVKEGRELNVEKFKSDLEKSLFEKREKVVLSVETVTDSVNKDKYGILALLGEGTSHFAGSIPGRIHNLTLAAERTNGVLVAPGDTYSMNDSIGPVDAEHGFQMAYIIQGNRTVLGAGGGVCQTSTTLFRAVLNSGLPVVARYPHAYRVGYYEQDMPVGFDAAVFQPSWDFKFKNDTTAYVLVQSSANLADNSLTFKLYGTPDGRTVEISKPVITNQTPPPEPLYEDDPTLKKGTVLQVDYAAWGASSVFTRTVKKGDAVLFTDTFSSRYQPWRAIYKVGTKEN